MATQTEFQLQSKEIAIQVSLVNVEERAPTSINAETSYKLLDYEDMNEEIDIQAEGFDDLDENFHPGGMNADDSICSQLEEDEIVLPQEPTNSLFIVYWSCLTPLFRHCLTCGSSSSVQSFFICGTAITVELLCNKGHIVKWRSQPLINHFYHGNLKLSPCVLFSSNTYRKILKFFKLSGIPFVAKSRYYEIQRKYLFGVANEAWIKSPTRLT